MTSAPPTPPVGTFCLVLHTHLPWLARHGTWPVGEEWLHQAWAHSYLPVVDVLERLATEGRRDLLTLGVTPVLAAQLDDPYCLDRQHAWLGGWRLRAEELASRPEPHLRGLASSEFRAATRALDQFGSRWVRGASPVLRALAECGAVELLGGPVTHAITPLLDQRVADFALRTGLDDHAVRLGQRPVGIWAPECAYAPGLEDLYAAVGVRHLVVDGPTLLHVGRSPDAAWTLGDSDVVAVGRDLEVAYRVWSPRRGYPGGPWYRDFHTYDHPSGIKPARVTSTSTPPEQKAPYDAARALAAVAADAEDFVEHVRRRLLDLAAARGRPGLVMVAYDTELFGHWWSEGPMFLERILRLLPSAGVRVTTLSGAIAAGHLSGRVDPQTGSWGAGKDLAVWEGDAVSDLVAAGRDVQRRLLALVDDAGEMRARRPDLDAAATQALLALASDWAFMVSHDSTPDYARRRASGHLRAFADIERALRSSPRTGDTGGGPDQGGGSRSGGPDAVGPSADVERPFPHLDARLLATAR
ncbi:MAG TPA: 1,4-alpha-glucan branching protein domain-containing protein [Jiangellales bacterium]|nr:1,4-alpha-glucan branching protein domain-containing protein [Jiangellales bacterium]